MNIPAIPLRPDDASLQRLAKRILRAPFHALVDARMRLDPQYPWLAWGAVSWLARTLRPEHRCFEWGAGRSTLFLARRCGRVVSVEHDPKWAKRLGPRLVELDNVDFRFVPARDTRHPERTMAHRDLKDRPEDADYGAYVGQILDFPARSFDLVLIDGRSRLACARTALDRIESGGWLVLDNSERVRSRPILELLRDWERRDYANGLWMTSVFSKP